MSCIQVIFMGKLPACLKHGVYLLLMLNQEQTLLKEVTKAQKHLLYNPVYNYR